MAEDIRARDLMLREFTKIRSDETLASVLDALVAVQGKKRIPNAVIVTNADGAYEGILTARLLAKSLFALWQPEQAVRDDDQRLDDRLHRGGAVRSGVLFEIGEPRVESIHWKPPRIPAIAVVHSPSHGLGRVATVHDRDRRGRSRKQIDCVNVEDGTPEVDVAVVPRITEDRDRFDQDLLAALDIQPARAELLGRISETEACHDATGVEEGETGEVLRQLEWPSDGDDHPGSQGHRPSHRRNRAQCYEGIEERLVRALHAVGRPYEVITHPEGLEAHLLAALG